MDSWVLKSSLDKLDSRLRPEGAIVTAILSRPHFYLHHDSAAIVKNYCCLVLASNEREMAMLLRMLLSAFSM